MNPVLAHSATRLAELIRKGEVTSAEVVETHIDRIRQFNPHINAIVKDRFKEAREEAAEADRRIRDHGPNGLPPFHGVPCSIKESFALTGMPHTSGLVSRKGVIARRDATAVGRLKAAGAIPLGVTNISELCMWMESYNKVYGRTGNPYDPRRIAGGSSGGEGAIVGAGGVPFGLGSDIGGSIRLPSFFNGVFGHKPTGGLVPGTGQFPPAPKGARRYVVTGPIARRAEDLWPLLNILAGPDGLDDGCREFDLGDPDDVDLSEVRVLDVPDNGTVKVADDLRDAQRRAVDWLRSRCAAVERTRVPGLKNSLYIWSALLSAAGGPSYEELLADGRPFSLAWETVRSLWGGSPFTVPSIGLAILERIPKLLPGTNERFLRMGHELREELVERLGPDGVMIYPSYTSPAPRHRMPLLPPFNWVYTAIINVMELPSTQVPLGLNRKGLPLGVQIVGNHGNDHLTIAVARALEEGFGGWVPPRVPPNKTMAQRCGVDISSQYR